MKKLEKIKLGEFVLNNNELKQLKGGADVVNDNSSYSCRCTYHNPPSVANYNSSSYCSCDCVF